MLTPLHTGQGIGPTGSRKTHQPTTFFVCFSLHRSLLHSPQILSALAMPITSSTQITAMTKLTPLRAGQGIGPTGSLKTHQPTTFFVCFSLVRSLLHSPQIPSALEMTITSSTQITAMSKLTPLHAGQGVGPTGSRKTHQPTTFFVCFSLVRSLLHSSQIFSALEMPITSSTQITDMTKLTPLHAGQGIGPTGSRKTHQPTTFFVCFSLVRSLLHSTQILSALEMPITSSTQITAMTKLTPLHAGQGICSTGSLKTHQPTTFFVCFPLVRSLLHSSQIFSALEMPRTPSQRSPVRHWSEGQFSSEKVRERLK
ncbi:hypothetical protein AVEN_222189-1 [Araneus ventricosus]|uniref:Uncharacterized protein n=1 Tax=Araneus ventricosus TaxID=182803 RepID=A0A4Y2TZT1_ARAVE|nr:hypothetical protein AVEN_222189-1 [Araneus ventricosus]